MVIGAPGSRVEHWKDELFENFGIERWIYSHQRKPVVAAAPDEETKGAGEHRLPAAPVDLSLAMLRPDLVVVSRCAAVAEGDGAPMTVKTMLQLFHRLSAEDDFDRDTLLSLRWFDQEGWAGSPFGHADLFACFKVACVGTLDPAGVLRKGGARVCLLRKASVYFDRWEPCVGPRTLVRRALRWVICAFRADGEAGVGKIIGARKARTEANHHRAPLSYPACERRGWAEDVRAGNERVTSWMEIDSAAGAFSAIIARHFFPGLC